MGVKFTPEVRAILQEKALKMFEENPYASFASVSKALGIHKARVWDWYSSNTDGFRDKYKKVLDVAFAELEAPAIATLGELIQEKNFQAVKYVLDHAEKDEVIIAAGSLYMIGHVRSLVKQI